jgi:hypothetical protein
VIGRLAVAVVIVLGACTTSEGGPTERQPNGSDAEATNSTPGSSGPGSSVVNEGLTCWSSAPTDGTDGISFSDQTEAQGLVQPLVGMYGHSAVWGDFNGDQSPDLFVGTFADRDASNYQLRGAEGPSPDRVLYSGSDGFTVADGLPDMFTRTSGGAVGDFDVDGDLDLVVSRNFDDDTPDAPSTQILRNDDGTLVPMESDGLPTGFGGRSVVVFDYDGEGLPDLFIAEDRFSGGSSVLLRNLGGLAFEDTTAEAGLPLDLHGLGAAVADLTGDGYQDLFVSGSNRLFVAAGDGTFIEADSSVFGWQTFGPEDDIAGVSIADVNRDAMLDIAIGQHFNSTIDDGTLVPVRLYLNRGTDEEGSPSFEDVTQAAGLIGLPTKAPHVEINDFDNDGWPDLLTTASASDGTTPAVFQHMGLEVDIPIFSTPAGLGQPQYWVAGPTADVDRDGRLDVFLVEWEPSLPSLLLRNESGSGHWLEVSVGPEDQFGLGWRIEVYRAGGLGELEELLGARDITVTQGYSAGVAPIAHFGLGEDTEVDLRLIPPSGVEPIVLAGVGADQHVRFPDGCS